MSQYIRWPATGSGGSPSGPAGGDLDGTYPNPTIALNAVTNSKMAQMATMTIKGNDTGGTADPQDLSVTEVTAMLNVFVGDSGAGGTKGLVPAPGIGDAVKFLKGDGTWGSPAGAGTVTSVALGVPAASLFGVTGSPITGSGTIDITTTGTSGGIPYFSSTSAMSSSALLAANQLVLGGGAGTAPATLGSLGTSTQVLHGNASGAPTWGAVSLTADVTGTLPVGNGGTGVTALSDITGTADQVSVTGGTARVIGGNVTLSLPQSIATTSDVTFDEITGTTGVYTQLIKSTSSGGLAFQANSGTPVLEMGSGGGSNVTFEGNVVHKGSVAIRETGGGTDSVTLAGPTSTTGYTITLPGTAPSANTALTYNGSVYSWSQVSLSAGVTGTLPLANGGTAKALTAAAGGVVYTDSDSMEVTAAGTSGDYLKSNGTSAPTWQSFTTPTVQRFTSGSGTYTTPANVKWIKVTMVGGGAGGAGSGTATGTNPTAGGDSTFGSSLLTAGGGGAGTWTAGLGGSGGSVTVNSPAIRVIGVAGGDGGSQSGNSSALWPGGNGGVSALGGAGRGGSAGGGAAGGPNSGSGGGGAGINAVASGYTGPGGGAGGYIEAIIASPSATYSYSVGAGGNAGGAGTSGSAGGAGGSGVIVVEEFYQ